MRVRVLSDLCPHAQGSQKIVRVLGESVLGNDAVGTFPLDVDGLHAEVVVPLLEDPVTVFALNGLVCSIDLATTQHAPTRPQSGEWYRTLEWRPGAPHMPPDPRRVCTQHHDFSRFVCV